jgi:23S rRNA pseudouridine2605 synthase/23S rRNA pseudouridine2604 synthase
LASSASSPAPTVRDLLPPNLKGKIYPVGRLDKDSEGLLLLTNDGPLSYRLTHPKFEHEKEYDVTLKDEIRESALDKLRAGVMLDGSKTKPAAVLRLGKNAIRITLTEGRNRQIRSMCSRVGSEVVKLVRVRITTLADATLKPGKLRLLTPREKAGLLASVGL